jgi:signal transduction histidine kinase
VRTTLAATIVVAAAFAIGGALASASFRSSLIGELRAAAIARASDIASLARSGHLPPVLGLPGQEASFAQVVGPSKRVVAASANIGGEPAIGPLVRPRSRVSSHVVNGQLIGQDGQYELVALPVFSGTKALTVYAGYSLATAELAIRDLEVVLIAGLPIALTVVAGTTWAIVGWALRPVDAMRERVAEITTQDLHQRVPEPQGRDELSRLAQTMNSMLDRLEAGVERQRSFVADASHELRSPLNSLRAQLEIGLARGAATDWLSVAGNALAEEARLERLVTDLLLLARLDSAPPSRKPAAFVDLTEVVRSELAKRCEGSRVSFTDSSKGPVLVALEPELARRVVANLLDNAERHARSQVSVCAATDGDRSELIVADDGPGIAPENRERVFERFTRLDTARSSDEGGAGLGLAILRDIVVGHGGTVTFVDAPIGARAVVRLPSPRTG